MNVCTILGARPQFIKAAAVSRCIAKRSKSSTKATEINETIIHTGQHYDDEMSGIFFAELGIPAPTVNLNVHGGSSGMQVGRMLEKLDGILNKNQTDCVIVYGDTNSTLAGALAANSQGIPLMHVEAGLRSKNMRMPEERNRVLTDRISTVLCCPTESASRNLQNEGLQDHIHIIGDVMYDSLLHYAPIAEESCRILERLNLSSKSYDLATIHRPVNTENSDRLQQIFCALNRTGLPVVFPVHPRTRLAIERLNVSTGSVVMIDPVGYLDMISLTKNARIVLTDSGGLQKEACWLGTPCVVLREETEWVELIETGWCRLAGANSAQISRAVADFEENRPQSHHQDTFGNGRAVEKIVDLLEQYFCGCEQN